MAIKNIPFTYLIGWKNQNKWYYGVRYAQNCHPDDLWINYFTSSKFVKDYRFLFGDPDIIQIRRIFKNTLQAKIWEDKVIRRMNVVRDDRWLNMSDGKKNFHSFGPQTKDHLSKRLKSKSGYKHSDETKKKIGEKSKGRFHSEESKEKARNKMIGYHHSIETRKKISANRKGKASHIGEKNPMFGKKQPTIICEYCNLECSKTNHIRFHGEKCKLKEIK